MVYFYNLVYIYVYTYIHVHIYILFYLFCSQWKTDMASSKSLSRIRYVIPYIRRGPVARPVGLGGAPIGQAQKFRRYITTTTTTTTAATTTTTTTTATATTTTTTSSIVIIISFGLLLFLLLVSEVRPISLLTLWVSGGLT